MTDPDEPPVLIVGAGPTGLAAALELARHGRALRIVDQSAERSRHSKAIGINARTLDLLEPSGVSARLLERGLRIARLNFRRGERRLATIELDRAGHRHAFMTALLQAETERILEEALAAQGVAVEWSTTFRGLAAAGDHVAARLARGAGEQTVAAAWLIGADGAHSAVREALRMPFDGTTDPRPWQIVDARLDWPFPPAAIDVFARPLDVLGVIPIADDLFRLVSNGRDPLELLPQGARLHEEVWRSAFRISYRQVASYRQGRVLLAGDAAHVHSPVGARGMNLGIEDGTLLARKLVAGGLDSYSAERHPVGAGVIRQTGMLTRLVTARSAAGQWLRDLLFAQVIDRSATVQRALARRILGLA